MPPFDAQKHSFVQSMNAFAEGKIEVGVSMLAKSVPCSVNSVEANGDIVTVKIEMKVGNAAFPLIKCPVYGPQYLRWPLQKGDMGVLFSADYYLGGVSGLGTGVADMTPQFNLSTGVFFPIGNTIFGDTEDAQKTVIYGPEGVILKGCPIPQKAKEESEDDIIKRAFNAPGRRVVTPAPRLNVPAADVGDQCGKLMVDKNGVTTYGQGDETGTYTTVTSEGFKVYINGSLTFVVDAGGMRWLGGNAISGGGNFGINVTPTGTHIDDVNFLPHVHKGVQTGTGVSGVVDDVISPAEDVP